LGQDKEEVKELWGGYASRLDNMIVMGTIFVTGSFVLLGAAATTTNVDLRVTLAGAAPFVYLIWFFTIQLSTRIMNDIEAEMRLIVNPAGPESVKRILYGPRYGNMLTFFRRNIWVIYVPLIVIASQYIGSM
jgi:hypothetical protein